MPNTCHAKFVDVRCMMRDGLVSFGIVPIPGRHSPFSSRLVYSPPFPNVPFEKSMPLLRFLRAYLPSQRTLLNIRYAQEKRTMAILRFFWRAIRFSQRANSLICYLRDARCSHFTLLFIADYSRSRASFFSSVAYILVEKGAL
jgi:hypothetical protein